MKLKRVLSLFLCLVVALGACNFFALAESEEVNTIKTYITISRYGGIVEDKDGNLLAQAEVELDGKSSYNLDDVFKKAHELYYDGGEESGYASATGEWGQYITEFWGDESGNFGYQVNSGEESVLGLSHEAEDGDYIDVCIYKNVYPDTESYSRFDELKKELYVNEQTELILSQAGYDENWNTVFSPCADAVITVNGAEREILTDADGKALISFDAEGEYIVSAVKSKEVEGQSVPAITAPICVVTVKALPDAVITVPSNAKLFVGLKPKGANGGELHYVKFTQINPIITTENNETASYYFELENNKTYNYRVTGDSFITYAGTFKKTADFTLDITEEELNTEGKEKTTVDRDTSSNNGYNVADIYLNINPKGYLCLDEGDIYQIVSLRNWETVNSTTANYFIEPDYHYFVIDENGNDSDIISIDENGLITAKKEGTAIVLVTYDALNINYGKGKEFYGAIWPENTGVFVVSVGKDESGIVAGMTINSGSNSGGSKLSGDYIDAEHDVIYFMGDCGSYTFTPQTEDVNVSVANPVIDTALSYGGFEPVDKNADKSFTVGLKSGRNIVKLEKDGNAEYQVITAKEVSVTINDGADVHPGDTLNVVFDALYHPANKLAGVYNMSANAVYKSVSGYDGKIIGGLSAQYNFVSNSDALNISNVLKENNVWGVISYKKDYDLTVPEDYEYDTFKLSDGMIYVSGWGDPYGNHRAITYENGKGANLNADPKLSYLGRLPDIEIPIVATDAVLESISLDTKNVKTEYYAGDSFDTEGLVVTANYADQKTQTATGYTISPEILSADTERVTVTYRGKTAEIEVKVSVPKVKYIVFTASSVKTSYKAGDTFDPTGMIITAIYENGEKKAVTDYSYSPNRVLQESDTEIIVTYIGDNAVDGILPVSVPITVTASSGGSDTVSTIKVYCTLLGDEKHGTPSGSSDTHTLYTNNLEKWIAKTAVTVEKGSYVIDVIAKALSLEGIPYVNEDNYISSIGGLAEFSNGPLSGWMYTLNGKYPDKGIAEQTVKNGDKIVFHYTDDYTKEESEKSTSSSSGTSQTATYTIKFETNGANGVKSQSVVKSGTVTEPAEPEREGYAFAGWYLDKEFKNEYDFSEKVTSSFTLYAKWTEKDEEDNKTLTSFSDVKKGSWYEKSVAYAVEKKLFKGISDTEFAPEDNMTRAMLVTVLYRLEDVNESKITNSFKDVDDGAWYKEAVIWAAEAGIVNGVSDTEFAPNENITREQMAAIIYRYAKMKGYNTKELSELSGFMDVNEISSYALEAVKWANGARLINGVSDINLSPKTNTTRAEVAAILMRFCENIAK